MKSPKVVVAGLAGVVSLFGVHRAMGQPACPGAGTVYGQVRITEYAAGFGGTLQQGVRFGVAVAPLGDLDGDGVADLAVGSRNDNDGGSQRGAVWIVFLNPDGTVKAQQKISDTAGGFAGTMANGDQFGNGLACLGDLDGDGVADLAVGAPGVDDGAGDHLGGAWILFLNTNGTVKAHQKISATAGGFGGTLRGSDFFGAAVGAPGDIDGDGIADLVVGADGTDDAGDLRGAAWILFLNRNGTVRGHQRISATAGGFAGVLDDGDQFGIETAGIGDLNGDGTPDLAVGAIGDDDAGFNRGAVWILLLNPDGTVSSHAKISDLAGGFGGELDDEDFLGIGIGPIDDLDGDGVDDLLVGAHGSDIGGAGRGSLWVLFMNTDGTVRGEQQISQEAGGFSDLLRNNVTFGVAAMPLGDLNGDGRPEIAVGAHSNLDASHTGEVWILRLNNCSPPPTPCPADFNGDGSLDIFDFLAFSNAFDLGCP